MYGAVLTAWSLGGVIGPQITAYIKDIQPKVHRCFFIVGTVCIACGLLFAILMPSFSKNINGKMINIKNPK